MRRRMARVLVGLAAVALALEVAYLVAANAWLNSGRLEARISRHPGRYAIRWGSAWTLWPGHIRLNDVAMRGGSARLHWYARLDAVGARFRIAPLFERAVHLRNVRATGVDYRHRLEVEAQAAAQAAAPPAESDLPPLPEVAAGPHPLPPPRAAGRPRRAPWTIVADDIRADIAQLWLDRYRLAGAMRLTTSMNLVVRGPMAFPDVRLTMTGGRLSEGARTILGELRLDIATSLGPLVPKGQRGLDVMRMLSGRFRIDSGAASLLFLEAYLRKAPWLRFNGTSVLAADLRLEGGHLQPGSTLDSRSDDVDIDFLDRKLTGRGRISARVDEADGAPLSRLEVVLADFALWAPDLDEPFARGTGFKISATSAALDLENPFETIQVIADLPEAVIPDLSYYNRYIPADSGLAIHGGTGRIRYHVETRQGERTARGTIALEAEDIRARFEGHPLRGDVTIQARLAALDPVAGRFDVSGTRIDLSSRLIPWTASLSFPKAVVRFGTPMEGRAETVLRMTDTSPLVAMFDAQKDISRFAERLMTIRDIAGTMTLSAGEGGCTIDGLDITGHRFHALADLALRKGGKDGILYLRLGIFSLGVAFDDGKKDLDLVRARAWFEKQRAARRGRPGAK